MTSLIQLPIARSNDIEPTTNIERDLTSVGLNSTFGPSILTDSRRAFVISVILMVDHFAFMETYTSGVRMLVLCSCMSATCLRNSATAHARGCPVLLCSINPPLTLLFCVVKKRLKKINVV